ncbi:MAG: dockerin type I domain-containing protein [Planctomycetota bacterium]
MRKQTRRSVTVQTLDERALLAADVSAGETMLRYDINNDSAITSNDALRVINHLDREGPIEVADSPEAESFDSNRDGRVSPFDALVLINHISQHGAREIGLRDLLGEREPLIGEEQRDNFRQLFTHLNGLRRGSEVTPRQIMELIDSVATAFEDATLPSEESVDQLIESVRVAVHDGELSESEREQLATGIRGVLASANISEEDAQTVADNLRGILDASGVEREDVATILGDLQEIVTEFGDRDPLVGETQRENIRGLLQQLTDLVATSDITLDQIRQLRSNIRVALENASEPNPFLVFGLARDARAAFADGELSEAERATLSSGLDSVLESADVSEEHRDAILSDIESLIDSSNLTLDDLQAIAEDLVGIGSRPSGGFFDWLPWR